MYDICKADFIGWAGLFRNFDRIYKKTVENDFGATINVSFNLIRS